MTPNPKDRVRQSEASGKSPRKILAMFPMTTMTSSLLTGLSKVPFADTEALHLYQCEPLPESKGVFRDSCMFLYTRGGALRKAYMVKAAQSQLLGHWSTHLST